MSGHCTWNCISTRILSISTRILSMELQLEKVAAFVYLHCVLAHITESRNQNKENREFEVWIWKEIHYIRRRHNAVASSISVQSRKEFIENYPSRRERCTTSKHQREIVSFELSIWRFSSCHCACFFHYDLCRRDLKSKVRRCFHQNVSYRLSQHLVIMGLRHDSTLASDWEWKILDFRVLTLINFCPDFQRENWNWFGSVCCWQRTASQRSDLQRSRTSLPSLNEKSINAKLYKLSIPAYKFPSDINLIWMGTVFQERTALNERGERNIIDSEEIDFADIKSRTNFF